jgi:hypothetical protein
VNESDQNVVLRRDPIVVAQFVLLAAGRHRRGWVALVSADFEKEDWLGR